VSRSLCRLSRFFLSRRLRSFFACSSTSAFGTAITPPGKLGEPLKRRWLSRGLRCAHAFRLRPRRGLVSRRSRRFDTGQCLLRTFKFAAAPFVMATDASPFRHGIGDDTPSEHDALRVEVALQLRVERG
jgi:hypothetical protein